MVAILVTLFFIVSISVSAQPVKSGTTITEYTNEYIQRYKELLKQNDLVKKYNEKQIHDAEEIIKARKKEIDYLFGSSTTLKKLIKDEEAKIKKEINKAKENDKKDN